MKKDNAGKVHSEINYIKSVMQKSELNFRYFQSFFLFLAVHSFVYGILLRWLMNNLSRADPQRADLFLSTLLACVWQIAALIPILIVILVLRKGIKRKNQGMSLWLFDILAFVLVFCGTVLPVASTAVCATEEAAELFAVFTSALILLLCGIFSDSKALKVTSYIYLAIPIAVLSVMGLTQLYLDFVMDALVPVSFAVWFSYIKSFAYVVYPAIGYAILDCYMAIKGKGTNRHEF